MNLASAPKFVCHGCIGDAYLKAEIVKERKVATCMICGKKQEAMLFDELCERVHEIVSEEFVVTDAYSEGWEEDWERSGDPVDSILYEIVECDEPLIEELKERLSDQYFSFDAAKAGEENPYGNDVQYKQREPNDYELQDAWSVFEAEIRTRARFFSKTAENVLDDIFGELNRFRAPKRSLVRDVGPGTSTNVIFRARQAFGNAKIAHILEHPARELGAPPFRWAGSGRMNPRWISMFYGAFDADTCVAEIRAPVGSSVIIGRFQITRPLRLLDLEAFRELFVERASYFDSDFRRLHDKARFLARLVRIMSRPVMPNDEDFQYLPTQAVAEYLSEKIEPKLDGLIFPSTQRDGKGENVVLFRRAVGVETDGTDELKSEINFGWATEDDEDRDITVWTKPKRKAERKKWSTYRTEIDLGQLEHEPPVSEGEPALRLDLENIEIRDIKSVEYRADKRRVRRHKETKRKLPF